VFGNEPHTYIPTPKSAAVATSPRDFGFDRRSSQVVALRTTIPAEEHPPLPDLIGRRFAPAAPDVAWVGDITYVATGEGWLYVASVLDLGSRRLLGYSMAAHMRTELVADALEMPPRPVADRPPGSSSTAKRQPIPLERQPPADRRPRHDPIGRPHRGVLAQRGRRIVLVITQTQSRRRLPLRHASRCTPSDLRLDQPIQPTPPALEPRLPAAHRVGTAIPSIPSRPGRVTNVTGQRGSLTPSRLGARYLSDGHSRSVGTTLT
jgi:Integrase core domain